MKHFYAKKRVSPTFETKSQFVTLLGRLRLWDEGGGA